MKFEVYMLINIDEESNLLPISEEMYDESVEDLIRDIIYDIDGAEIIKLEVKQR